MNSRKLMALCAVAAIAAGVPTLVVGQEVPSLNLPSRPTSMDLTDTNPTEITQGERATRIGNRRNRATPTPPPPSPAELVASAQTIATAAGSSCQVSEAVSPGVSAEGHPVYEAACATGPGYILIGSTPPQAVDCVLLAGQADIDRARNPAATVGTLCTLPANTDVARVVATYAQDAGIACTVDQGASIGKSPAGNLIYEVGCANADGFWIEKLPAGWDKTGCLQVVTQDATCRFTTPAEQATTMQTMLANSEAAACNVTQARYMGSNANGAFYEAKCGDEGGYIASFNTAGAVQRVYPCAEAQRIGGGCTLTAVAAAPATAETTPAPAT